MSFILQNIFLFFSAFLAGCSIFLFDFRNENRMKLMLSFSGAFLFGICVLHLLPELYQKSNYNAGIYILFGFFLQILLEFFSEGIEHGHVHIHKHHNNHGFNKFPYLMMVSLSLHSFLEGMPLSFLDNSSNTEISFVIGIILHNIPISIALMQMLLMSGITKKLAVAFLFIFSFMAPLGSFVGYILQANNVFLSSEFYPKIMGIVIGIFLHISTTILFETNEQHRFNRYKFFAIIAGGFLAVFSSFI
mgnify:CR=1 FL=1